MGLYRHASHRLVSILEPEKLAGREVCTVETTIDLQRTAEPTRSIDQFPIEFNRPDQDG
jgi:hypothetical protein